MLLTFPWRFVVLDPGLVPAFHEFNITYKCEEMSASASHEKSSRCSEPPVPWRQETAAVTNRLKERTGLSFAKDCQAHGLNAGSHVPFYHG